MEAPFYILIVLILWSTVTDIKSAKIPNALTMGTTLFALAYHSVIAGWSGLAMALIGFFLGISLLLVMYILKSVGAGDVKLFGSIGALMGWEFTYTSLIYSIIYAGLIGLLLFLVRQQLLQKVISFILFLQGILTERKIISLNYARKFEVATFPFMYAVVPAIITASYYFMRS